MNTTAAETEQKSIKTGIERLVCHNLCDMTLWGIMRHAWGHRGSPLLRSETTAQA